MAKHLLGWGRTWERHGEDERRWDQAQGEEEWDNALGGTGCGDLCQNLCPALSHGAAMFNACEIAGREWISPIVRPTDFLRGRG